MKRIMSVDQSTSASGVGFFINGKLKDYCLIKPKMSKRADELRVEEEPHLISIIMPEADYGTTLLRITAITDQLEKLIEKFKPDEIWFEEIFENAFRKGERIAMILITENGSPKDKLLGVVTALDILAQ